MPIQLSLADDEVHLWSLCPESVPSVAECLRVLSDDERDQQRRFACAEDRQLYAVARAAVRCCLARYVDVDPTAFRFVRNPHGRPELTRPRLSPSLGFNLSHTRGLAMIGVAWGREIGVDVEDTTRSGETLELASGVFAPQELRQLHELDPDRRRRRFFELWTLKEAYLKARGQGLSLALDQFMFQIVERRATIRFGTALADDPLTWQFAMLEPSPAHQAAVAVRRAPGQELRLTPQGSPL
jgi:4'-phosphopantetheinyl transferase